MYILPLDNSPGASTSRRIHRHKKELTGEDGSQAHDTNMIIVGLSKTGQAVGVRLRALRRRSRSQSINARWMKAVRGGSTAGPWDVENIRLWLR
jgi:hypothetical protein